MGGVSLYHERKSVPKAFPGIQSREGSECTIECISTWDSAVIMKKPVFLLERFFFFLILGTSATYLEKVMAPHSSTLAWKTPWMEEPGRLQFMGSLRVGYD